ncbi:MAG TPA: tetratricopeptide repeat protein, partial [Ktedonobacteraceae bacterium]|nr:tetratricopeptide repeat protein [Ktedonobacteraceae bacterium]
IEDALKRDPYNGELWDSKGEILLAQKRYQEAVEAYHQAVQCSPQNKKFRRNAAAALQQLKENQRSRPSDRMKEAKHTRSDNNSRK